MRPKKGSTVEWDGRKWTVSKRKRVTHPLAGPQDAYILFLESVDGLAFEITDESNVKTITIE